MRIAILLGALAGCPSTNSPSLNPPTQTPTQPPAQPTQTGSDGSAAPKNVPADAVHCEADKDCNQHACGPCNSGDVLTQHDISIKCFRNPCPQTTVSCKNNVCTVN